MAESGGSWVSVVLVVNILRIGRLDDIAPARSEYIRCVTCNVEKCLYSPSLAMLTHPSPLLHFQEALIASGSTSRRTSLLASEL
jgi:hypothetical protein